MGMLVTLGSEFEWQQILYTATKTKVMAEKSQFQCYDLYWQILVSSPWRVWREKIWNSKSRPTVSERERLGKKWRREKNKKMLMK